MEYTIFLNGEALAHEYLSRETVKTYENSGYIVIPDKLERKVDNMKKVSLFFKLRRLQREIDKISIIDGFWHKVRLITLPFKSNKTVLSKLNERANARYNELISL